MIGLLQRVKQASVEVNNKILASIQSGLLVFVGIEKGDDEQQADRLLKKLLGYRVFADENGKMNLSLSDTHGGLLLIPQFTLPADTGKGMRPSFSAAAPPATGKPLFDYLLKTAKEQHANVQAGEFGADMHVALVNDGPVTFWLQTKPDR